MCDLWIELRSCISLTVIVHKKGYVRVQIEKEVVVKLLVFGLWFSLAETFRVVSVLSQKPEHCSRWTPGSSSVLKPIKHIPKQGLGTWCHFLVFGIFSLAQNLPISCQWIIFFPNLLRASLSEYMRLCGNHLPVMLKREIIEVLVCPLHPSIRTFLRIKGK